MKGFENETVIMSIAIPAIMARKARTEAAKRGLSRSALIRKLLEEFLEKQKDLND